MLSKLSEHIVVWLSKNKVISEEEIALYNYAVFCLLMKIIPLIIIFVISVFIGNVIGAVILSWIFVSIRYCTGGYHAQTPLKCVFMSVLIIGGTVILCTYITDINHVVQVCLLLWSVCNILAKAPIDSPNRRLSDSEKVRLKKATRLVLSIYVLFYAVALLSHKYNLEILFGIFLVSVMLFEKNCIDEKCH